MRQKSLQAIDNKNRKMEPAVAIISLNAQKTIEKTLTGVKDFLEIIVVDNGSSDQTVDIAKKYTKKIYSYPIKNLRKVREYALKKASSDWVFFIDTDEVLTEDNRKKMLAFWKKNKDRFDGFWLVRRNYYGQEQNDYLKHGLFYPDYQLRLFKRKYHYVDTPHELPDIPKEKTYYCSRVELYHYQDKRKLFSLAGIRYLFPLSKIYSQNFVDKNVVYLLFNAFCRFFDLFFISLTRGKGILDGYYGILAAFNFACHVSLIYLYAIYLKFKKNR